MKKTILLLAVALSVCCMAETAMAEPYWGTAIDARHDSILSLITGAQRVEQSVVSICQLGAKPITSTRRPDCRPAFVKAMQRAAKQSGGMRIVVPVGDWFVKGPIHLVSHVTLELQEGAHLFFSDDARDYLPTVKTSWEGNFCENYSPFIYGYGLTDVAIVGRGTIDGNCANRCSCVNNAITKYPTKSDNTEKDICFARI